MLARVLVVLFSARSDVLNLRTTLVVVSKMRRKVFHSNHTSSTCLRNLFKKTVNYIVTRTAHDV